MLDRRRGFDCTYSSPSPPGNAKKVFPVTFIQVRVPICERSPCYTASMQIMKSMIINNWKQVLIVLVIVCGIGSIGSIFFSDRAIESAAKGRTYSSVEEIPAKKTGLVLGTSKYALSGRENLFYRYRIQATIALYESEKIEFVLISGDNGTVEYNEPEQMQADLVEAGIPEEKIFLDYAGFRTWDSVIRANAVFLEDDFIVISQEFHNQRALYAAQVNNIEAIAFNAQDVPVSRSPRVWVRERLARVNAVWDNIVNTEPRFYGESIHIQ